MVPICGVWGWELDLSIENGVKTGGTELEEVSKKFKNTKAVNSSPKKSTDTMPGVKVEAWREWNRSHNPYKCPEVVVRMEKTSSSLRGFFQLVSGKLQRENKKSYQVVRNKIILDINIVSG